MNKKILKTSLRNIILVSIYIFAVSQVMQNGSRLFGEADTAFTPFAVLLLFTLSAAVVGGLVFGQSVYLFLDGKKKESITAGIYSVVSLGVITVLAFIAMIIVHNI